MTPSDAPRAAHRANTAEPAWLATVRAAPGPWVVMLCGLTGSGKTRLALELERSLPALRFTIDEWMIAQFGEHMPRDVFEDRIRALDALIWDTARRTLALGVHVVLDAGLWSRTERAAAVARARAAGATPFVVFLDVPRAELERRLLKRNARRPAGSYEITPDMLDAFEARFEPPGDDEGLPLLRVPA